MDFAVLVHSGMNIRDSEKIDVYLENKQNVEYKSDGDTNCK